MKERYFPEVVQAIVGGDRTIYVYFSDGKIVLYDVGHLINRGGIFEALKDDIFFTERLTVLNGTAAWDLSGNYDPADCIDLDPFVLYEAERVQDPLEPAM